MSLYSYHSGNWCLVVPSDLSCSSQPLHFLESLGIWPTLSPKSHGSARGEAWGWWEPVVALVRGPGWAGWCCQHPELLLSSLGGAAVPCTQLWGLGAHPAVPMSLWPPPHLPLPAPGQPSLVPHGPGVCHLSAPSSDPPIPLHCSDTGEADPTLTGAFGH